jgi:hypothetical protein
MKGNFSTFEEFASRVYEIEQSKQDYIVPTAQARMDDEHSITLPSLGRYELTPYAERQLATKIGIPAKFWDTTLEYDGLREQTVNTMLAQRPERKAMVRTLDSTARAILSDRYRPIDNMFVLNAIWPTLQQYPDLQFNSTSLTDRRMYLQVSFPSLEAEIQKGDVVRAGLTFTNSEVGSGAVNAELTVWRLVCSNGMIGKSLMRSMHVGRRLDFDDENTYEIYRDDTIEAEMRSLNLRLRDVVHAGLADESFQKVVAQMRGAAEDRIEQPESVIENVTKRLDLPDFMQTPILMNMAEERNMTRWGVINGITNYAKSVENRDQQYDLERVGSKILGMSKREWSELATVA